MDSVLIGHPRLDCGRDVAWGCESSPVRVRLLPPWSHSRFLVFRESLSSSRQDQTCQK